MIIEINSKKDSVGKIVRLIKKVSKDERIASAEKWGLIAKRFAPGKIEVLKGTNRIATAILTT